MVRVGRAEEGVALESEVFAMKYVSEHVVERRDRVLNITERGTKLCH